MLFYNYSDITFSYSTEENRFYISNNTRNETIKKLRIFDYYSDTVIDAKNDTDITPGSTWWFVPPYSGNIPNAKNGYYVEIYFSDRVVRKNIGIIDFDYKHPLHKKFLKHKFEEIKYNEFSDFSEYELYNEFNIKPSDVKTYVDIGANYGMSSIPFITSNSKVYMIDADSTNIRILETSYGKDNKIKIINKAIHSYDGVTSFYEEINGSCVSSISYSNVIGSSNNRIEKKVECISPNTLIEMYVDEDEIDLLKIDIEGAEYEFFSSISDENMKKIKKFVIEFHMNENYRVMNIIKKLTKNDFKFKLARWERENNDDYIVSHTWGIIYAWN
jgi:FkbM family methyltransferase